MPRFFVEASAISDGFVTLTGENAHHIAFSLRRAPGDRVTLCDRVTVYDCELVSFTEDTVLARIMDSRPVDSEPPFRVHLYQALPKGDKLDGIIQKAVECGVASITTFESERCVVRLKEAGEEKKLERRRRIAVEAAKQSGRGALPAVHPTLSFAEAIRQAASADIPLFCYEGEGDRSLSEVLREKRRTDGSLPSISVVIGSEGGFSQKEAEAARAAGLISVGLGKRILRTETAAITSVAMCMLNAELSSEE